MASIWLPLEGNWQAAKIYAAEIPPTLYRYRRLDMAALDRFDFEVVEEGIFLSGAGNLNDPDEGRLRLVMTGSRRELVAKWVSLLSDHSAPRLSAAELEHVAEQHADEVLANGGAAKGTVIEAFKSLLNDLLRIACFTTTPINAGMWSKYGTLVRSGQEYEAAGICIEYATDEDWRKVGLAPVSYSDIRPTVNVLNEAVLLREMADALFVKSKSWENECEWRIIAFLQAQPPYPKNLTENSKLGFQGGVRSLIFGPNTPTDVVDMLRTRLDASGRKVPLKRVVRTSAGVLSLAPQ